ncbi:MAG: M20/M25/M40 family metallo-hydrolase, partial [Candidatus Moranbacteria bacterium]|nr:M20/M25/M40 family metallo-hydrolase [Candidatus Moranbacteria bacterium]
MKKILKNLIEFETIKENNEQIDNCHKYISDFLKKNVKNSKIKSYTSNKKPSIVATIGTKNFLKPKIMLHGHFDVVEGNKKQFKAQFKGDKIFGRSALDMKSGVAIAMQCIKNLSKEKNP